MTLSPDSAILTYHSLDGSGSVVSISPDVFRRQMEWLAASGLPVVPLEEAASRPGSIALTFDDGYRNFISGALPVLAHHRFPATVFVVSARCGLDNAWPGQGTSIPRLPLMGWAEIAELHRSGISIGSHTRTHPDLRRLSPALAEAELRDSRDEIAQHLGAEVRAVAYPYGASTPAVRRTAAALYSLACGTRLGYATAGSPRVDLPRLDVFYLRDDARFRALATSAGKRYLRFRALLRMARSWI